MSEITMPSFPAGTRREETAQARAEMAADFFKPEFVDEGGARG